MTTRLNKAASSPAGFLGQSTGLWLSAVALAALSACSSSDPEKPPTLNGEAPMVVAHRGASGYLPEHTVEAYAKAIELGADAIEPDLVVTKDGVLIARHDPNLKFSTNVADHPEFASRKKTTLVDGESQEGWFASDFTLVEIKTLGALMTTDATRPQQFNGLYKPATFQEIIDLAKAKSKETGRVISVYPETKNPTYHRDLGLPIEDTLIKMISDAGWNSKTAPVFVQSFEPSSLKYLRGKGLNVRLVQLIDADDYDFANGTLTYTLPYDRPYDWTKAGDKRLFSSMVTVTGLTEIKTYADGIGPWKPYIVPIKGTGKTLVENSTQPATTLVADAHKLGLIVHPYTFRNEARRLAKDYSGDPRAEYLQFYRLGVDGVFSDFTDTAVTARQAFMKERGYD